MTTKKLGVAANRPVIFDYGAIAAYITAMLAWHRKAEKRYSLRRELARQPLLSRTLLLRIAQGKRRLTAERAEDVARILKLNSQERLYFCRWAQDEGRRQRAKTENLTPPQVTLPQCRRTLQNHLLHNWLNVYVKDAAKLSRFTPEPEALHKLLGGIATPQHIRRSLNFLLREGFLRKTIDNRVVTSEVLHTTSDEVPNVKIRTFHRQALNIARRNLDLYPLEKRRESAVIVHLNQQNLAELKDLLKEFYERLLQFAEAHPDDDESLYQVLINLTPIGG